MTQAAATTPSSTSSRQSAISAIILIGGPSKGTRFRPLSLDVPKPLFPMAGFPIIYHHIQAALKLPNLQEIILLGFYEPKRILSFIDQSINLFQLPIKYLVEEGGLGTGGGIHKYRNEILSGLRRTSQENTVNDQVNDYVFVIHGDILCSFPLLEILNFHRNHGKAVTLLGKKVIAKETGNYGCLVQDPETHEVLHYAEKPETFVSDLVSCGVYLFSAKSLFNQLQSISDLLTLSPVDEDLFISTTTNDATSINNENNLDSSTTISNSNPRGDVKIQLEQNLFVPLAGKQDMYVYVSDDWWMPLKHAGVVVKCCELLLQQYRMTNPSILAKPGDRRTSPIIVGDVLIHPTAQVHPTAKLGPNVTIGKGVVIGAGVRVKHSIILDNVEVKDRACILYSTIGWNSVIKEWTRIEGVPDYDPSDFRSCGITIFGNDVTTGPELIVRKCIVLPNKQLTQSHFDETLL